MSPREQRRCDTCSAWSELIAKSEGGGPVQALCLKPDSPMAGQYTTGRTGCHQHTTDPAFADHPSGRAPRQGCPTCAYPAWCVKHQRCGQEFEPEARG